MKKLVIHAISDTHRSHLEFTDNFFGGCLAVHAGDSECDTEENTYTFLRWAIKIAPRYKFGFIITGGNHDSYLAEFEDEIREFLKGTNVHLLLNQSIIIEGLKVFASPHSEAYGDVFTAFAGNEFELQNRAWPKIDRDTDVLITHGPALGILDGGYGSKSLLQNVKEIRPIVHIFGHIHHDRGIEFGDGTTFANVAAVDSIKGPCGITEIQIDVEKKKVITAYRHAFE